MIGSITDNKMGYGIHFNYSNTVISVVRCQRCIQIFRANFIWDYLYFQSIWILHQAYGL